MNPSLIKQHQDNLLRLATQYTQQDLDSVMEQNELITSIGLEMKESGNYVSNRAELKESLEAFQLGCAYLSLCNKKKTPCSYDLHSGYLKSRVEYFMGTYVPSGAIVAAAECLGIKYWSNPKNTQYVRLYISKKLPFSVEMEHIAREL